MVPAARAAPARAWASLPRVVARLARLFRVTEAELAQGNRRHVVAAARAAVGAVAVRGLGLPARRVGPALGVTGMAILRGLGRGEAALRRHGLAAERVAREVLAR